MKRIMIKKFPKIPDSLNQCRCMQDCINSCMYYLALTHVFSNGNLTYVNRDRKQLIDVLTKFIEGDLYKHSISDVESKLKSYADKCSKAFNDSK